MIPASRSDLKEYCLRKLGKPVLEINCDDAQLEDAIDDAIQIFQGYHDSGVTKVYYKKLIDNTDFANGYVTIPDDIINVTKMWPTASYGMTTANLYSANYQFILTTIKELSSFTLSYYTQVKQYLSLIERTLYGEKSIRFNRYMHRAYIDAEMKQFAPVGFYNVFECYQIMDPETYTGVWNDEWLKEYTTALFRLQWGHNLSKFGSVALIGGVQFNGEKMIAEASADITRLKEELMTKYHYPLEFFIG